MAQQQSPSSAYSASMVPVNQGRLERRMRSAIESLKHNTSFQKAALQTNYPKLFSFSWWHRHKPDHQPHQINPNSGTIDLQNVTSITISAPVARLQPTSNPSDEPLPESESHVALVIHLSGGRGTEQLQVQGLAGVQISHDNTAAVPPQPHHAPSSPNRRHHDPFPQSAGG